jgi:parallel beta-helix repeat protein
MIVQWEKVMDKYSRLRKYLVVGIVMLFVEASCIPVFCVEILQPQLYTESKEDFTGSQRTIRVDDEGDGDYRSITEAVNHSSAGDIIEVYSGTYYERNITLTQQGLILKGIPYELGFGNDSGKPQIDGGSQSFGWIIGIQSASNVTLTGFYFQNPGLISELIWVWNGTNNLVSENVIDSARIYGIGISSNAKIFNNTFIECGTAIESDGWSNWICGNVIHDCRNGMSLFCSNTTISDNTIYNCEAGIWGNTGSDNVIERNWIYNCDQGLWFNGDNLVVERNRVSNCSQYGIGVKGTDSIIAYNLLERNFVGVFAETFRSPVAVEKNNFIHNSNHATFWIDMTSPGSLQFRENYWGRQHFLPEYFVVLICKWNEYGVPQLILPFTKIDWNPAKEPYDISG